MEIHLLFAKASWLTFFVILLIRPFSEILNSSWLKSNLKRRKELGIICGIFAFLHISIYLYANNLFDDYIFNSAFWNFKTLFAWGNLATVFLFFPFITSNNASKRFLKKHWLTIQKLSYPAFIFTGIHIYLVNKNWILGLVPVLIWLVVWTWAQIKKHKNA